jgi:hypothetical protein
MIVSSLVFSPAPIDIPEANRRIDIKLHKKISDTRVPLFSPRYKGRNPISGQFHNEVQL